jgi:hypothetical protein
VDKIKALMKKCGVRPELADRLCEGITKHLAQEKARLQSEFKQRQAAAKQVCLEEVETYKRELARRLQIFCEAKGSQIEHSVARQTAIRESAAQTKLRDILSLLEGVEPNGGQNGNLQAENKKLKRQLSQLSENHRKAVEVANRQTAMAGKVLGNNRRLEAALQESRRNGGVSSESRQARPAQRIDEGRQRRQSGEATTTRPTLRENQERAPRRQPAPVVPGDGPEAIAADMSADLL